MTCRGAGARFLGYTTNTQGTAQRSAVDERRGIGRMNAGEWERGAEAEWNLYLDGLPHSASSTVCLHLGPILPLHLLGDPIEVHRAVDCASEWRRTRTAGEAEQDHRCSAKLSPKREAGRVLRSSATRGGRRSTTGGCEGAEKDSQPAHRPRRCGCPGAQERARQLQWAWASVNGTSVESSESRRRGGRGRSHRRQARRAEAAVAAWRGAKQHLVRPGVGCRLSRMHPALQCCTQPLS